MGDGLCSLSTERSLETQHHGAIERPAGEGERVDDWVELAELGRAQAPVREVDGRLGQPLDNVSGQRGAHAVGGSAAVGGHEGRKITST